MAVSLDIASVGLTAGLFDLACSACMVQVYYSRRTYPGFGWWALGMSVHSLGAILTMLRAIVGPFLGIVVGNLLLVASISLIYHGLRVFRGLKLDWWMPLLSLMPLAYGFIYFTHINPHLASRIILVSLAIAFALTGCAVLYFLAPSDKSERIHRLGGWSCLIGALVFLFRAVWTYIYDFDIIDYMAAGSTQAWIFMFGTSLSAFNLVVLLQLNFQRLEQELHDSTTLLQSLAITDHLTGLANRRQFEQVVNREMALAKRQQLPLSMLVIDLDHFKDVNDTHGHESGDQVLRFMADCCVTRLRETDFMARIGGEEFAVLLPATALLGASRIAETLRLQIKEMPVRVETGVDLKITASFGVAEMTPDDRSFQDLLRRADAAMYLAKRKGRDRVEDETSLPTRTLDRSKPLASLQVEA